MKSPEGLTLLLLLMRVYVVISVTCHRAEYQIGEECCPMCPPGTRVNKHCTEFRSTSCLPCDEFTYMDEPTGRTQCLRCRICASGSQLKVKTACSSTANAVCEAQVGHFCKEEEEDGSSCRTSQRHKICEQGQFIQKPGSASEDTQCSSCLEGTFSNGTESKSCQQHTQCETTGKVTVKAGTLVSDAECGERSSKTSIIVATVGTVVLVLGVAAAVAVVVYRKRAKANNADKPTGYNLTSSDQENGL